MNGTALAMCLGVALVVAVILHADPTADPGWAVPLIAAAAVLLLMLIVAAATT